MVIACVEGPSDGLVLEQILDSTIVGESVSRPAPAIHSRRWDLAGRA
jgi:hypothetical protein